MIYYSTFILQYFYLKNDKIISTELKCLKAFHLMNNDTWRINKLFTIYHQNWNFLIIRPFDFLFTEWIYFHNFIWYVIVIQECCKQSNENGKWQENHSSQLAKVILISWTTFMFMLKKATSKPKKIFTMVTLYSLGPLGYKFLLLNSRTCGFDILLYPE